MATGRALAVVVVISATSCSDGEFGNSLESAGATGISASEPKPGLTTAIYVDPDGRTWINRGPTKYSAAPPALPSADSSKPRDSRRPSAVPVEELARSIKPVVDVGGVEFELSEGDSIVLAQAIKDLDADSATSKSPTFSDTSNDSDTTIRSAQVVGTTDDRANINVAASFQPYIRTAGLYYNSSPPLSPWCTCFKLINEHTCITAGHCLYNPGVGWYPGFNLRFGLGGPFAKPEIPWCHARAVPSGWASGGDSASDYGVIILHGRFGANCNTPDYSVGWYDWNWYYVPMGTRSFAGYTVGYPGTPPFGWTYPTMTKSASNDNYLNSGDAILFTYHQMDTSGGQSGSPIFNNSGQVVGIHKGTWLDINRAISMNPTKIDWMTSNAGY
jgi:V8-like Glu-specific endopeptidase